MNKDNIEIIDRRTVPGRSLFEKSDLEKTIKAYLEDMRKHSLVYSPSDVKAYLENSGYSFTINYKIEISGKLCNASITVSVE